MSAEEQQQQPPASPPTEKISDVTIYGATSFVAKYVIEYLLAATTNDDEKKLRITLAGRNETKLTSLLTTTTKKNNNTTIDTFTAECTDYSALHSMTKRTRVVINCAGPFSQYGTYVVKACAATGCDYVDITGELDWAADVKRQFDAAARESGARIVSFCGFDSIPSDVAVWAAVREGRKRLGGEKVDFVRATTWHVGKGLVNGGTLHTALDMGVDVRKCLYDDCGRFRRVPHLMSDPFLLAGGGDATAPDAKCRDEAARREWTNQLPAAEPLFNNAISIPFVMAVVNAKIVYASAVALRYSKSGSSFTYGERFFPLPFSHCRKWGMWTIVPSLLTLAALFFITCLFKLPFVGKKLALWLLPPGTGSPDFINRRGYAQVRARVETSEKEMATCVMTFEGDPGNLVTAQCVVESALCLLLHKGELDKDRVGFGTPVEMFGDILMKRLKESPVRKVDITTFVGDCDDPKKVS
mmetsp:Transcript_4632/g.5883  ORF Transcript_4632/g.5883 Transcript_4632/m.5883 type:complete len:470 (+) Transcript_4632:37-1446(+)|eukprot:CAMPEP_0172500684 /NCGR_PEP_ID=MMETSP1066-20121228/141762_1 /TAXON_ID=671091 /ORGANISM="Coscinodiscus wailesii, Strain CCMP2513" /LENGTH=469 /DNA_ID=CAMNT_0013275049 /DNA_START=22 /DNA_END=1431 /DNA_ORIENTATION=-